MSFTHDDVQRIIQLLNDTHFDELHLEADGIKLDVCRNGARVGAASPAPAAVRPAPASSQSGAAKLTSAGVTSTVMEAAPASAVSAQGLQDVRAPMLGTFFRAPKPGAAPFVAVGDRVKPETVIGIIEVMKLMNSVAAGVEGEVVEILGCDGELVEYDQVLLRVRPD